MAWLNLGLLSTLIIFVGTVTVVVLSTLAEVEAEKKLKTQPPK